jgi:hypothetical protein
MPGPAAGEASWDAPFAKAALRVDEIAKSMLARSIGAISYNTRVVERNTC